VLPYIQTTMTVTWNEEVCVAETYSPSEYDRIPERYVKENQLKLMQDLRYFNTLQQMKIKAEIMRRYRNCEWEQEETMHYYFGRRVYIHTNTSEAFVCPSDIITMLENFGLKCGRVKAGLISEAINREDDIKAKKLLFIVGMKPKDIETLFD
jgi:hypothetical protein